MEPRVSCHPTLEPPRTQTIHQLPTISMESWLAYNPELEMMRWRLQVLAMGLQHQGQHLPMQGAPVPFVPFHLQPTPETGAYFPPGNIKQEPQETAQESSPSHLMYRPAFQTRCGSVSPRLESRGSSSGSPSSYRSSPSPTSSSSSVGTPWSPAAEQSEPLDLSMGSSMTSSTSVTVKQEMMPPNTTITNQACNVCNKEYSSPAALNMHMRTHTAGCKCPFCGKSFSRPWLLQGHIRTHTGEKPYSCTQCNKSFADKSNLRAHVQTHSDVKPFSCTRCGKKFALKSYLTKHEESSCLRMTTGRF